MTSPYAGLATAHWAAKTRELIEIHPLNPDEIYEVVIQVWREIFESNLTSKNYSNPKSVSITGSQAFSLGINVPRLCLACYNRGRASGSALPGRAW